MCVSVHEVYNLQSESGSGTVKNFKKGCYWVFVDAVSCCVEKLDISG